MLPIKTITRVEYALLILGNKIKHGGLVNVVNGDYYQSGGILLERKDATTDGAHWYVVTIEEGAE